MLYHHFKQRGFCFSQDYQRKSGQHGPDLCLIGNDQKIWIEAAVPKPEGVPDEWRNPAPGDAYSFGTNDFDTIRLRWTGTLSEKRRQCNKRIAKNVVSAEDPYVLAVNSCMLHHMEGEDFGLSQLPFAVEAVLPIGPLTAVPGSQKRRDNHAAANAAPSWQCEIQKSNGSLVRTDSFLDKTYSCVSALLASSRVSMPDGNAYLIAVHNPLAKNPVALGTFGAHVEYTVEEISDTSFVLRKHPHY